MNKAEFNEKHGHRYSRCYQLKTHEPHPWTRRSDAPRINPWWCGGAPDLGAMIPLNKVDFLRCYPEVGHQRICEMIEPHPEHNWSSPQGRFWCSQPKPEDYAAAAESAIEKMRIDNNIPPNVFIKHPYKEPAMNEPYDQTIRPLLCGSNKAVHGPHNWEAPPNRIWACPGRDVECNCEPSDKLGLDNPGLHILDCPSYRGPERNVCSNPAKHEPHAWRENGKVWGCPGQSKRAASYLEEVARLSGAPVMRKNFCSSEDVHATHIWSHNSEIWECPGIQAPFPRPCGSIERHEIHMWHDEEEEWQCPGTVRPKPPTSLDALNRLSAFNDAVDRSLLVNQSIPEEPEKRWAQDTTESVDTSKPGMTVARWADKAMFSAEPIDAQEGPRVYLLWMTPDPLGAIAAACKIYKGEVVRDLSTVTDAERLDYLEQIQKTKLKAPFEFVDFHFMIEGVTRAFTHQMVRQRTAVYAQESLRFAVKEDMPVGLPPSIPRESPTEDIWNEAVDNIQSAYNHLVDSGIPAEDARGLLPTNILTRLHYSTDLRALLDHAGNRLCTQAQFEWRLVFSRIVEAIRNMATARLNMADGTSSIYMAEELTDLFKPVCYQTGKCEFKANFDRACSIRERVDFNEAVGIPSSEWGEDGGHDSYGHPVTDFKPIKPGEWLLDPGAARKKG